MRKLEAPKFLFEFPISCDFAVFILEQSESDGRRIVTIVITLHGHEIRATSIGIWGDAKLNLRNNKDVLGHFCLIVPSRLVSLEKSEKAPM